MEVEPRPSNPEWGEAELIDRVSQPALPPEATRRSPWIMAFILGIVLIPMGSWWICTEVAAWYQAAAQDALLQDQRELALQLIRNGIAWNSGNLELRTLEADLLFRLRRFDEAIAAADACVLMARQSLAMLDTNPRRERLSMQLNQAAYTRAVAEKDLDVARKQIDESIQLLEGIREPEASILDTRGYIAYKEGKHEEALADLEAAGQIFEDSADLQREQLRQALPLVVEQRGLRKALKDLDEAQAVILYHRGMARQKLGKTDEGKEDLARAKELGYNPERGIL